MIYQKDELLEDLNNNLLNQPTNLVRAVEPLAPQLVAKLLRII